MLSKQESCKKQKDINEMVFVEGSVFEMGSDSGEKNEKPIHQVKLDSFYIGKYPVTQQEYKNVMGTNPAFRKDDYSPVEQVNWYDAVEFCNKKSELEGLVPCYSGSGKNTKCNYSSNGYRLATEAEWEYAAKGGIKSKGYLYSGSDKISDVGWDEFNSKGTSHQVGMKKPNELGLYDMSGNVWEWCNDWYDQGYYCSTSKENPKGAEQGTRRVIRGGAWTFYEYSCRITQREKSLPLNRFYVIGFRVVRIK